MSQQQQLEKMTPELAWKRMRDEGSKLIVKLTECPDKPVWLDEKRFAQAKAICAKYYIGISYSSFTGLLLILQLPDGLEPLLSTGNSKDIPSLFKRYLSTVLHIRSWYEDDIFDAESKGYKSIRQVRSMHKRVQGMMNDKFKVDDVSGKPRIWLSQYDMAMTQFAFIGLAMLYPEKTALIGIKPEDLELINYYWRVLGYLMGLEDEYNMCQFDKYQDIETFNRLVLEREYMQNFRKLPCPLGVEMSKAICTALHYFMPLVTFNNLAHWWKGCFQFNGYEPEPMSLKEKLLHTWTRITFYHLLKSDRFRGFATRMHKKRFDRRLKNRDQVHQKLAAQYKDHKHLTFYSSRRDYFGDERNAQLPLPLPQPPANSAPKDGNNNAENEFVAPLKVPSGCPFGFGANHENTRVTVEA